MIKMGQIWIAKEYPDYSLKVLKFEEGKFFVRFFAPKNTRNLRFVDDYVTAQYIKEKYYLKGKEKRK